VTTRSAHFIGVVTVPVELLYLNPVPLKNVVEIKSVAPREVIGKHYLWGVRIERGRGPLVFGRS